MLWNHSSLASFLSRTVKAMLIQSRIASSESHNVHTLSVPSIKHTLSWIRHHWCQQQSRRACCRNVQLMPMLLLKLTQIWQRENGKFVDFNDPTQIWRCPSNKRLRVSTHGLYCWKLDLLTYIFAADSMGLRSLVFTWHNYVWKSNPLNLNC